MAQYWEDWSGETVGSTAVPAGWQRLFGTTTGSLEIVSDVEASSGKALSMGTVGGGQGGVGLTATSGTANMEVYVRAKLNEVPANSSLWLPGWVRCSTSTTDGVAAGMFQDSGGSQDWRIRANNPFANIADSTSILLLGTGDIIHVRLRASSTSYSAKFWRNAEAEPGSWTLTGTDASHASGFAGVGAIQGGSMTFLEVGIGTAGDSAPKSEPVAPGGSYRQVRRAGVWVDITDRHVRRSGAWV